MERKKNLTLSGMTTANFIFILNAAAMIGVSIYLTSHFYETLYPSKLGGASALCNISNFLNCDAATYSKLSNVAGVPISFFGIVVGLSFIFSSLMPSESMEKTISAISKYNFIGCIVLFLFSLISLGSLCPFCTIYYILSGIAFYILWKFGINSWLPEIKSASFWGVILLAGSFFFYQETNAKESSKSKLNTDIVEQFKKLPSMGDPDQESVFKIHQSSKNFSDAPIRISVFSDFECPFCKVVAEQVPELIRRYKDKISVQYFFYPLDAKCNPNIKSKFHENACDAATLAACDEKRFTEIHDEIFANQEKLKSSVLADIQKKYNLKDCIGSEENKLKVISSINQSTKYNLKSTPTIIVNGKKIEGSIPNNQFFAIFESILSEVK